MLRENVAALAEVRAVATQLRRLAEEAEDRA
jgi:hypothetical protein